MKSSGLWMVWITVHNLLTIINHLIKRDNRVISVKKCVQMFSYARFIHRM